MTAIERRVASIWAKVLHIDGPTCGASFVSLGGDLQSARLIIEEVRLAFNICLPLPVLLEDGTTLEKVAALVEDSLDVGPLSN